MMRWRTLIVVISLWSFANAGDATTVHGTVYLTPRAIKPAAAHQVQLVSENEDTVVTVTDSDGYFSALVNPGVSYTLSVSLKQIESSDPKEPAMKRIRRFRSPEQEKLHLGSFALSYP